jgi:hypothetical protein
MLTICAGVPQQVLRPRAASLCYQLDNGCRWIDVSVQEEEEINPEEMKHNSTKRWRTTPLTTGGGATCSLLLHILWQGEGHLNKNWISGG